MKNLNIQMCTTGKGLELMSLLWICGGFISSWTVRQLIDEASKIEEMNNLLLFRRILINKEDLEYLQPHLNKMCNYFLSYPLGFSTNCIYIAKRILGKNIYEKDCQANDKYSNRTKIMENTTSSTIMESMKKKIRTIYGFGKSASIDEIKATTIRNGKVTSAEDISEIEQNTLTNKKKYIWNLETNSNELLEVLSVEEWFCSTELKSMLKSVGYKQILTQARNSGFDIGNPSIYIPQWTIMGSYNGSIFHRFLNFSKYFSSKLSIN